MQTVKGGYSFVEFDTVSTFTNPTRIDKLLKAGTGFTPKTLTEDFADNTPGSAGKALDMSIRTADVDDAAGSAYALLKAAEEARTPMYFRFVRLLGEPLVVEDCEDAWNESVGTNMTSEIDATDAKTGMNSIKLTATGSVADGALLATEVIEKDLRLYKGLTCWAKSSTAKAAGALSLLLDDSASCASPLESMPFPALEAGVWTRCSFVFAAPVELGFLISIGVKSTGLTVGQIIHIDDVRAVEGYVTVLNKIVPKVTFESNEAGKHNAIKITGEGFADTEANLMTTNF
jgi:hypothetical protein